MPTFGFGQPHGGVIQMAYTVSDIRAAIDHWVGELGVGPWFLLDHFGGAHPVYRGRPSQADVAIAMAFAGHMQIELIQPNDQHPSVYREAIERRGHGFHHIGRASDDIDRDIAALEAQGYRVAFHAGVPTGGDVAYLDRSPDDPYFIELIAATDGMDQAFTAFWRASVGWDGREPVRPFA